MMEARTKLKLTQADLGEMCQINGAIISQIENGIRPPTPVQRHRLLQVLGNDVEFLADTKPLLYGNVPDPYRLLWVDGNGGLKIAEDSTEGVGDQIQQIMQKKFDIQLGEKADIRMILPSYAIVEIQKAGFLGLFKVLYKVDADGKVEIEEPQELRTRVLELQQNESRMGVPDMPAPKYTKDGQH